MTNEMSEKQKANLIKKITRLAFQYKIAEYGSKRQADIKRRYQEAVNQLGYDPLR